jgi:hypothetical protein
MKMELGTESQALVVARDLGFDSRIAEVSSGEIGAGQARRSVNLGNY